MRAVTLIAALNGCIGGPFRFPSEFVGYSYELLTKRVNSISDKISQITIWKHRSQDGRAAVPAPEAAAERRCRKDHCGSADDGWSRGRVHRKGRPQTA